MKNNQKIDFIDRMAESPKTLLPIAVITVIACAACVWFIAIALDAQARTWDKKLILIEAKRYENIFNKE